MTLYYQNEYLLVGTPVTICFLSDQQEWFSKIEKINSDEIVVLEPKMATELRIETGIPLILTWADPDGLGQVKCVLNTIETSPTATYWKITPTSVFEINQRRAYPRINLDLKLNLKIENDFIPAHLINLSYEGLKCELNWVQNLLNIGNKVKVNFLDASQETMTVSGEIVRIKLTQKNKADLAIYFDKSDNKDNEQFSNYFFYLENKKE